MNKKMRLILYLVGAICIPQCTLLSLVPMVRAQSISEPIRQIEADRRPRSPNTGTPSGDTIPPGTRPELACKSGHQPLTAIVANQGKDFTVSEHPTFLFYIPYNLEKIQSVTFSLNEAEEKTNALGSETIYRDSETIYRTDVQLLGTPGIIKIAIPSQPEYALKVGKFYHWYLMIDCKLTQDRETFTTAPHLIVNGWVRRVEMTPEGKNRLAGVSLPTYLAYREENVWQDAIATLAELHFTNPENNEYKDEWTKLLQPLSREEGLGELLEAPLVKSNLIPSAN